MAHDLDSTAQRLFKQALDDDRAGELLECLFGGGSATVDPNGRLVIVSGETLSSLSATPSAAHDYCTEDGCPCFDAGQAAVWEQIDTFMEDAVDRISQIRADYVERYENRATGRGRATNEAEGG